MKALYFKPDIHRAIVTKLLAQISKDAYWGMASPLRYGEVSEPELPSPEWVKVKTRLSGICGSDLAAITLKGSLDNPIKHFVSFPMFLGHEIVGEIAALGSGVRGFHEGDRVAVYPILSCVPRGISPLCPNCRKGDFHLCQNYAQGGLPPGQCIGTNNRTGGGFSEYLVAHQSQLFRIPDSIPDNWAVLLDPLCVALHAVRLAGLEDSHNVLVIGAGVIGLSVIQMIRALGRKCRVYAVARYGFQKDLATRCGADRIVGDTDDPTLSAEVAEELKARQYSSRFVKPFFMGGFDVAFDCVGSAPTIEKCIRWANHGGKVIVVGSSPPQRFEWSLLYWKEIKMLGSISFGMETVNDTRHHIFEIVFQMMEQKRINLDLFPVQTYRLEEYRSALAGLVHKGKSQPVKVAFVFP